MLSKSQIKLIKSLSLKKFRNKHNLFVVEGVKGIEEFLNSEFQLFSLHTVTTDFNISSELVHEIEERDLKKISFLKSPQKALAVFNIPENKPPVIDDLTVLLDGIRDPGNLGTIIRLCDWFGVKNLICSLDTVDCYNPKVVQSSMGSLSRVNVVYDNLEKILQENSEFPVYGTLLDGTNIYSEKMPEKAFIIMGNEANGISEEMKKFLMKRITIPQFGKIKSTESLNVATATSIILSEFRRNTIEK